MTVAPDIRVEPLCPCHGEPMSWRQDMRYSVGGYWLCRVKVREVAKRYRLNHPSKVADRQKRYASTHREQKKENQKERRRRGGALVEAVKSSRGNACHDCGSTEKLEWHHRDPTTKRFHIGANLRLSVSTIESELAKCDLLCRSCHGARHGWKGTA